MMTDATTPESSDAATFTTDTALTRTTDMLPTSLHLLPLVERPFFPTQTLPLMLHEAPWLDTLSAIGDTPQHFAGLVLLREANKQQPQPEDFHPIGCVIRVHNPNRAEGKIQFIAEGLQRFRIVNWLATAPPYLAEVEYLADTTEPDERERRAYALALLNLLKELVKINPLYSEELKLHVDRLNTNNLGFLADFSASLAPSPRDELQQVLATLPAVERAQRVITLLQNEVEIARLHANIRDQVDATLQTRQREFFLREQLKIIQKELGIAKDDRSADIEAFKTRLEALQLTEEAQKRAHDELQKLATLELGSAEYSLTRNYLDWISRLPWQQYSQDLLDLQRAQKTLDAAHYGLEEVKQRIIEFLAVGQLKGQVSGSIILLLGPPGVGKTSIGQAIAQSLGRQFYRFSVGGMRDEAEIKGHRRTYIGAMPGKFIQAMKTVAVSNPVIMLDEIDKIGASYQGDPAAALLEVLDPEQNQVFLDHYLDVRFDLSKVLFIGTANQLDSIPGPLLDRMEIIRLSGYLSAEKAQIAKRFLWPKQLDKAGLTATDIRISSAAIHQLIEGYARESGVRALDKQLARITRKLAVKILAGASPPFRINQADLSDYLGQPFFTPEKPTHEIGVVTGLAWTALGGATLDVEVLVVHRNSRGFRLTGKLGEVMRESAEIAYSFITAHLAEFGAAADFFATAFVHLHVPEGATPKDGPSAGVTLASALLSLALGRAVTPATAMTGELTLTGNVLAVGGIREKIVAAKRNKLRTVILPEANRRDYDELPDYLRKDLQVHFVKRYAELKPLIFGALT